MNTKYRIVFESDGCFSSTNSYYLQYLSHIHIFGFIIYSYWKYVPHNNYYMKKDLAYVSYKSKERLKDFANQYFNIKDWFEQLNLEEKRLEKIKNRAKEELKLLKNEIEYL